jgi:hypothetical protein
LWQAQNKKPHPISAFSISLELCATNSDIQVYS